MWALNSQRGQSATELALILPMAILLILVVVEMALVGVRSISAQHAAFRAARVAKVYQGEYSESELFAMLDPALFRSGAIDSSGNLAGGVLVRAYSRPVAGLGPMAPASHIRRASPYAPALPAGFSDAVLRGGDAPSPYCRNGEEYGVCGYPQ